MIGAVLGLTARLTISALEVAGSVIAQQLGLGFVTTVDPTQGEQGVDPRQFPHHARHHAVLRHRHALSRHRRAQRQLHAVRAGRGARRRRRRGAGDQNRIRRVSHRHPAVGAVPGVRAAVQSRARRAVAADAADAGVLRRAAAVDPDRLSVPDPGARLDDGTVSRLRRRRAARSSPRTRERRTRDGRRTRRYRTHRRPDAAAARGSHQARRRGQEHRGHHLVHDRRRHAGADGVRGADGGESASDVPRRARPIPRNSGRRAGARPSRQDAGDACACRARHSASAAGACGACSATRSSIASCSRSSRSCRSCREFRRRPGSSGCFPCRRWPISPRASPSSRCSAR